MKKFLIFLTAMAMLGLVSCQSDKQENPNDTAISEPVEDITAEPVFTEYNQSDFAQINVAINKQSSDPVMPVNTYDLSKMNHEKLLSPCKLPENRDKVFETPPITFYDFVKEKYYEEDFKNYCKNPSEAEFECFAVCGDKVAVYADFDELCHYDHCYKIYEYDLKTEVVRELYSYSSANEGECIMALRYYNGELYAETEREITTELENGTKESTIRFDICHVTDGKLEKLFASDDIPDNRNVTFAYQETGRFILSGNRDYINSDDEHIYECVLMEYDTETGELTEIFRKEDKADSKVWDSFSVFLNGDDIITTGKDDDRYICIEGSNFRINTGIRGLQVQAVQGSRIIAFTDDTVTKTLYTYDLDKKECYISNINGVSGTYLAGGNVLLHYESSGYSANTLLIPELGASFHLNRSENGNFYRGYDGGKLWFADAASGFGSHSDGDGNRVYYEKLSKAIGELVIIGDKGTLSP